MGLSCSQLIHRRVAHNCKYSLWIVSLLGGSILWILPSSKRYSPIRAFSQNGHSHLGSDRAQQTINKILPCLQSLLPSCDSDRVNERTEFESTWPEPTTTTTATTTNVLNLNWPTRWRRRRLPETKGTRRKTRDLSKSKSLIWTEKIKTASC